MSETTPIPLHPDDEMRDRFWAKVKKTSADGCWIWQSVKNKDGYGRFKIANKMPKTHRISWTWHYGEIPSHLHVMHTCDNPSCVNPAHLRLGTHADNMKDKETKGRGMHTRGELNGKPKLSWDDVRAIRQLYQNNGMRYVDLAGQFNVSIVMIGNIVRGDNWKEFPNG